MGFAAILESPDVSLGKGRVRGVPVQILQQDVGCRGQADTDLVGEEARAAGAIDPQPLLELLDPVLHVAAGAVDLLVGPAGVQRMLVTTKRALSLGSHPSRRTTSALMMTCRWCDHQAAGSMAVATRIALSVW
jgi:hypothetical protein